MTWGAGDHRHWRAAIRPPARRLACRPHRLRSFRGAAGLLILGAAACLASPIVPRLAAPAVVDIHAAPPAPAFSLRPGPTSRRRPGVIVIAPASPLRPAIAPAVVLDGRLWCPQRAPTGGSTVHPELPEVSAAAVLRVERLAGAEAQRFVTRCASPTDGVVRIVTRSPPAR